MNTTRSRRVSKRHLRASTHNSSFPRYILVPVITCFFVYCYIIKNVAVSRVFGRANSVWLLCNLRPLELYADRRPRERRLVPIGRPICGALADNLGA